MGFGVFKWTRPDLMPVVAALSGDVAALGLFKHDQAKKAPTSVRSHLPLLLTFDLCRMPPISRRLSLCGFD